MKKFVSGLLMLLMTLPALAEDAVVLPAPQVDADPTGMILFAVVMVIMIGGYGWYIWAKERNRNRTAK